MRIFSTLVTVLVLAGFGTAAAQQPAPIDGRWYGIVDTDQGTMEVQLTITVDAGKASGTIQTNHGNLVISNGAFVKDKWRLPFSGHGMKGEIVGTVTGETFEGVWDNSPTATGSIRLQRAR